MSILSKIWRYMPPDLESSYIPIAPLSGQQHRPTRILENIVWDGVRLP